MQHLYSSMLCLSIYGVNWSGSRKGQCPCSLSHNEALKEAGILTIISYCEEICDTVFNAALGNKDNKLNKLLTKANQALNSLRNQGHFALPKWKTDR